MAGWLAIEMCTQPSHMIGSPGRGRVGLLAFSSVGVRSKTSLVQSVVMLFLISALYPYMYSFFPCLRASLADVTSFAQARRKRAHFEAHLDFIVVTV